MKRWKKVLLFVIPLLLAFMPIHAEAYDFLGDAIDSDGWYMSYGPPPNTLNYMMHGGGVWEVGGELNIISGGDLDVESGATFSLAGTDMTTQLGYLSGVTAGTATASKALVLGAAKQIATITTATITTANITTANTTNVNVGLTGGGGGLLSLYPTGPTLGKLTIGATDNAADHTISITNVSHGQATAYSLQDAANATADIVTLAAGVTTAGELKRADLTEEVLQIYGISIYTVRQADLAAMGVAETAGDHYLLLTTDEITLVSEISNNESETSVSWFQFVIPPEYVAAGDFKVRIKHELFGAGTDGAGSSTVDVAVFEQDGNGATGSDLSTTTAATTITKGSWATTDFVITAAGLVAGDIINIQLTTLVAENASSDLQAELDGLAILLDIKG